jgi:hypothetical protein
MLPVYVFNNINNVYKGKLMKKLISAVMRLCFWLGNTAFGGTDTAAQYDRGKYRGGECAGCVYC